MFLYQDKDILKPNYNTVDLFEVELVDSDGGPRENDTSLFMVTRIRILLIARTIFGLMRLIFLQLDHFIWLRYWFIYDMI